MSYVLLVGVLVGAFLRGLPGARRTAPGAL
jgi:hypothetical protein